MRLLILPDGEVARIARYLRVLSGLECRKAHDLLYLQQFLVFGVHLNVGNESCRSVVDTRDRFAALLVPTTLISSSFLVLVTAVRGVVRQSPGTSRGRTIEVLALSRLLPASSTCSILSWPVVAVAGPIISRVSVPYGRP